MSKYMKIDQKYKTNKTIKNKKSAKNDINTKKREIKKGIISIRLLQTRGHTNSETLCFDSSL
jgi:hypothetical protein